jgi:pSer/pThr/pTyr-binding forkhead associated (FHA) protein
MTLRATPIDRPATTFGHTAAIDPIDRPDADAGSQDAPLAAGRYLLVEQAGEQLLTALTRQITHVGRGFAATLQLEDPGVSRRHAIVMQRRGGVRILDDRSANGTWVNGERVAQAELRDGDVIVLGRAVLIYREVLA